jgi:hypothetical protein
VVASESLCCQLLTFEMSMIGPAKTAGFPAANHMQPGLLRFRHHQSKQVHLHSTSKLYGHTGQVQCFGQHLKVSVK